MNETKVGTASLVRGGDKPHRLGEASDLSLEQDDTEQQSTYHQAQHGGAVRG